MVLVLLRVGIFLFTGVWEGTAFIRVDPADSCWGRGVANGIHCLDLADEVEQLPDLAASSQFLFQTG